MRKILFSYAIVAIQKFPDWASLSDTSDQGKMARVFHDAYTECGLNLETFDLLIETAFRKLNCSVMEFAGHTRWVEQQVLVLDSREPREKKDTDTASWLAGELTKLSTEDTIDIIDESWSSATINDEENQGDDAEVGALHPTDLRITDKPFENLPNTNKGLGKAKQRTAVESKLHQDPEMIDIVRINAFFRMVLIDWEHAFSRKCSRQTPSVNLYQLFKFYSRVHKVYRNRVPAAEYEGIVCPRCEADDNLPHINGFVIPLCPFHSSEPPVESKESTLTHWRWSRLVSLCGEEILLFEESTRLFWFATEESNASGLNIASVVHHGSNHDFDLLEKKLQSSHTWVRNTCAKLDRVLSMIIVAGYLYLNHYKVASNLGQQIQARIDLAFGRRSEVTRLILTNKELRRVYSGYRKHIFQLQNSQDHKLTYTRDLARHLQMVSNTDPFAQCRHLAIELELLSEKFIRRHADLYKNAAVDNLAHRKKRSTKLLEDVAAVSMQIRAIGNHVIRSKLDETTIKGKAVHDQSYSSSEDESSIPDPLVTMTKQLMKAFVTESNSDKDLELLMNSSVSGLSSSDETDSDSDTS
jgi:hypothetical protein